MYLARKDNIQFYINDDKYEAMDALGYELYHIEEVPANSAAKNADTRDNNEPEEPTETYREVVLNG